jgi:hypothetical protein
MYRSKQAQRQRQPVSQSSFSFRGGAAHDVGQTCQSDLIPAGSMVAENAGSRGFDAKDKIPRATTP